ncbi:hypothetical protein FQR65_LT16119 [Abscondita terminalis]|nr:hypothetical protein FQR65_LT16119 [Abscondita terminalis]
MSQETLTREQSAFLEECLLEFSDRYTDADVEYKKVSEEGIPPPPIMHPWHGRPKLTPYRNRDRGGHRNHPNDSRERGGYENNYRDYDSHDRPMSGNYGKFIDRSPTITAAGKASGDPNKTVGSCLKYYQLQNQVDALLHDAGLFKKSPTNYKTPKIQNNRHRGIHLESRPILRPNSETHFQTLINDLKETSYESYWDKTDKPRDPTGGLPAGMDYENTTFGEKTKPSPPVKDLVNPPKRVYEVLWDSQIGHEMYAKTHNDYNVGERINRQYYKPAFNPNKRYGRISVNDRRGSWIPCLCEWCNSNPIVSVSKIQADVVSQNGSHLGKAPVKYDLPVSKEHMFGKPSDRDYLGVAGLLKESDIQPCTFKRDFYRWLAYLNHLRNYVKRRINNDHFNFLEFEKRFVRYDQELKGWVSLENFNNVCLCYGFKYEQAVLEDFFRFCGVIDGDKINYRDFLFLININNSVPEIIKIEEIPKGNQYYVTSYQSDNCDFLKTDNSKMPPAGVPSTRYDLLYPAVPAGGCRADLESLGNETTVEGVVNPNIYTNYGLTYRDFFMPRTPEIIKQIFEKIGYEFPGDTFDKLWRIGMERDKTGAVCVDTFKNLLNETVPSPKLIVEDPCY